MIIDCKVIDAKIGQRDVKVIVELHDSSFFRSYNKLTIRITDDHYEIETKGDYSLVRLAYDNFKVKEANDFAERSYKVKNQSIGGGW